MSMDRGTFGRFLSRHGHEPSNAPPHGGAQRARATWTPVSDWLLWPYQAYFPAACFVVGWIEREYWLNLQGLGADWMRAAAGRPNPRLSRGAVA
jgi:hypothetical protein